MNEQAIDILIRAKDEASKVLNKIQGSAEGLSGSLQTMGGVAKKATIVMTTALAGVVAFGVKSAISIEQTRVAFENLYGDAGKARDMMQSLSDFAKKTPFEFPELTDVALKLKNVAGVGDKELIPMLTNLGDIASSQSRSITQIVEAYNDAITGEYERLKEFGIKASKSGDNVTFSFQGQQQTVKATSEEIGRYLQELGQMAGIAGSMDKQSMTLGGRLSTLKDQFKSLSMTIIGVSETGEIIKGGLFDLISNAVAIVGTYLEKNQAEIKTYVQFFIEKIKELANAILPAVKEITETLSDFWKKHGETITEILTNFWEIAVALVKGGGDLLKGALKVLLGILNLDFKTTWEGIQNIVKGVFDFIVAYIKAVFGVDITQYIGDVLLGFEQMFTKTFEAIGNFVGEKIDYLKNKASEAANYLRSIMASYAQSSVGKTLSSAGGAIFEATHGARATGGTMMSNQPYLVGERGPELVIPKSASTVIPNNQTGGSSNISINFGGVSVRNDADIQKIAKAVEDSITRKMQLYRQGIA